MAMLLDFLLSRWIMIVGALIIGAGAIGLHAVFSAIPEGVNAERFSTDWAAPFVNAYRGVGQYDGDSDPTTESGRRIIFNDTMTAEQLRGEGTPFRRHTQFRNEAFKTLIYRDAIIFEFEDRTERVALGGVNRTHLWYASNAETYGGADEAFLDGIAANPLVVDYEKPVVIRRNLNSDGVWQIYISQVEWKVFPEACERKVTEIQGMPPSIRDSCSQGVSFELVDSNNVPLIQKTITIEGTNMTGLPPTSKTDDRGRVKLDPIDPRPFDAAEWRAALFSRELSTGAILRASVTMTKI